MLAQESQEGQRAALAMMLAMKEAAKLILKQGEQKANRAGPQISARQPMRRIRYVGVRPERGDSTISSSLFAMTRLRSAYWDSMARLERWNSDDSQTSWFKRRMSA